VDGEGKFIEEDEAKFANKETKIKAKLDEIDALAKANTVAKQASKGKDLSPNCKACKKCKAEKNTETAVKKAIKKVTTKEDDDEAESVVKKAIKKAAKTTSEDSEDEEEQQKET
jgi:hypothetical protein